MDWKKTLIKGLKALGAVFAAAVLGAVVTAMGAPDVQAQLNALADQLAAAVPGLGPMLAPLVRSALMALAVAIAHAADNARKHLGQ